MPDCPAGQTQRVTSNLHSSSSTMAVSRVPSPPLPEVNTPVAENWCYTQVSISVKKKKNYGNKLFWLWSNRYFSLNHPKGFKIIFRFIPLLNLSDKIFNFWCSSFPKQWWKRNRKCTTDYTRQCFFFYLFNVKKKPFILFTFQQNAKLWDSQMDKMIGIIVNVC